jgi:hypothetical protein
MLQEAGKSLNVQAVQIRFNQPGESKMIQREAGILGMRKPRGKKVTFLMGCGASEASGAEFIRRDLPKGEWECWHES